MKSQRQAKIMEIISTTNVETQEQLLQELQLRPDVQPMHFAPFFFAL